VKVIMSGCCPHHAGCPLVRAAQIRQLLAGVDHGAVHVAGDRRPEFARDDRHHGLVQQGQTFLQPALLDQGAALEMQRKREEVSVADTTADVSCPSGCLLRLRIVTRRRRLDGDRKQQEPMLGAFLLLVAQEPVGPGEPAGGLRKVPFEQQGERHPEHAARGSPRIPALEMSLVTALQRLPALCCVPQEIGRGRQQFEILSRQGGRLFGQRERGVDVGPRQL
jgi:hypothetical protein